MMDPLYEKVKWSFGWTVFFTLFSGKLKTMGKLSENR